MNISPLESLLSFLAPSDCVICKSESDMLCVSCRNEIFSTPESRCYLCNKLTKQQQVCRTCSVRSSLRRVWWLSDYADTTKQLVKEMKFHRKRFFAREFASILADSLPYIPDEVVVVPIPTAHTRVRQRGFDQAVVLAQQFAGCRGLAYGPLLRRLHQNDQIGKSRAERYRQMQNSFALTVKPSPNTTFLLVDDVLTTGATLESAAKLLRRHGAAHVDACVIARRLPT